MNGLILAIARFLAKHVNKILNEENIPQNPAIAQGPPEGEKETLPQKNEPANFRNNITVILSAGHGGTDPITGEYHCIAGGKQHTFSDGLNVREGDINRTYCKAIEKSLEAAGYKVENIHHDYYDYPLDKRVQLAKQVPGECCLIPVHHNASRNHNAKGFEVFTTRGQTASDDLAEYIWFKVNMLKRLFSSLKMRHDMASDGDHDKEANFQEIKAFEDYHRGTGYTGACAYIEGGFFDYKPDLARIQDPGYIEQFATAILKAVDLFYKAKV